MYLALGQFNGIDSDSNGITLSIFKLYYGGQIYVCWMPTTLFQQYWFSSEVGQTSSSASSGTDQNFQVS